MRDDLADIAEVEEVRHPRPGAQPRLVFWACDMAGCSRTFRSAEEQAAHWEVSEISNDT